MKIAVVGNTGLNIGIAVAADLSLAGHEVSFGVWLDQMETLEAVKDLNGIELKDPSIHTLSGRTGLGQPYIVTPDLAKVIENSQIVIIDVAANELEVRFDDLIPHLKNGQIVHFNTHGYWPALRVAGALRAAGKSGVTISEGITPTMAAGREGAVVTPHVLRQNILIGVFPAERTKATLEKIRRICHSVEKARNVIHSNLSSMNFLIHPGIALVNIGYFDRAEMRGEGISFYGKGNTIHAAKVTEALDMERPQVCAAFNVPFRPINDQIASLYNARGNNLVDTVSKVPFYRDLPSLPADVWKKWMLADLPNAHVPFVHLAELANIPVPLHRGLIDITDAMLGTDSWDTGLTLERLGLGGLSIDEITNFVTIGLQP